MGFALLTVLSLVASPAQPVSFEEALSSVEGLPKIVAVRESAGLVERTATTMPSLRENPMLAVEPGFRVLAEENRGFELGVGLTQGFSLAGEGERARAVLGADAERRRAQADALALEARLEVAEAWIRASAAERRFEMAKEWLELASEDRRRLELGAKSRAFTSAEVALAIAFEAESRLQLLQREEELFSTGILLSTAMGQSGRARATGALPAWEAPGNEALGELLELAARLPAVRVVALSAALAKAQAKEAEARAATKIELGAFVLREAPSDLIAMMTAKVSLPFFDVGARERVPAEAESLGLEGELKEGLLQAQGRLRQAAYAVALTTRALEITRVSLVPAMTERMRLVDLQFQAGELTYSDKVQVSVALLMARSKGLEAEVDEALARVRMHLLKSAISEDR